MIDNRLARQLRVLLRRFLTQGGVGVSVAVAAAAVAKAVVFADGKKEPDANFAILASPSWNTIVWVTAKATTGFTLNFSVAAPVGASVDYAVIRGDV